MATIDTGQRVVVVGSGATGSWAAHKLTEAGLGVLLLEAGSWPGPESLPDAPPRAPLDASGERRRLRETQDRRATQRVQRACYAFTSRTAPLFVSDAAHPYALDADVPYRWIRVRAVGGRTLVWNGIALRMAAGDFSAIRPDGTWPIGPGDLERHYRDAEAFFATRAPQEEPSAVELRARRAIERRWPSRRVLRTPRFRSPATGQAAGAAALPRHSCRRALESATRSGRLALAPDSIVSRLHADDAGRRIVAAEVVDARTRERRRVTGRAFVLCASALESTRILLNSASPGHPRGLGNASGLLGRYLSDHLVGVSALGVRGAGGGGATRVTELYVPPFRNVTEAAPGFEGSYGIQVYLEHGADPADGGRCVLHAFGSVLPTRESHVRLDPALEDAFGVPALRIAARYGENEARMAADQAGVLEEIMHALGYRVVHATATPDVPGTSMHEVGTARMGRSAARSVLDPWNRVWGLDNVFVTDGACFVEMGAANPTLTMLAITGRACEEIGRRARADAL
jgi:choline dehydrogenase-like flavoprotein